MLLGNVIAGMLVRYLKVFITTYSTTNNQLNTGNGGIQKLRYVLHTFAIPGVLFGPCYERANKYDMYLGQKIRKIMSNALVYSLAI